MSSKILILITVLVTAFVAGCAGNQAGATSAPATAAPVTAPPATTAPTEAASAAPTAAATAATAATVDRYRPRAVAMLGVDAFRRAFGRPKATIGPQPDALGPSQLWILPNPSGLNAHYQPKDLARVFRELRDASEAATGRW